jgi:hypothetical protein
MPRYQSGIALDPSGLSPHLREDISHSYLNSFMSTCSMSVGSSSGAREQLTRLDTGPHLQNIIGDLRTALG